MRKQEWIKITTPEGKDMIASPSYVKKLMGIDFSNVFNRIQRLELKIDRLESPERQKQIIELLRENGKHSRIWIENRVYDYRWYDLDELLKKGLLIETKSGSVTMYAVEDPSSGESKQ